MLTLVSSRNYYRLKFKTEDNKSIEADIISEHTLYPFTDDTVEVGTIIVNDDGKVLEKGDSKYEEYEDVVLDEYYKELKEQCEEC